MDLCQCAGRVGDVLENPVRVCPVDGPAWYVNLVDVARAHVDGRQVVDRTACLFHCPLVVVQPDYGTRRPHRFGEGAQVDAGTATQVDHGMPTFDGHLLHNECLVRASEV